jgi:sulfite reductase (ferredoxin)
MLIAARALVKEKNPNVNTEAGEIVAEFRKHYVDTDLFDPVAAAKFSAYLFRAYEATQDKSRPAATFDGVHQLIEEATVFIDAAHQCYTRAAERRAQTNLLPGA